MCQASCEVFSIHTSVKSQSNLQSKWGNSGSVLFPLQFVPSQCKYAEADSAGRKREGILAREKRDFGSKDPATGIT